MVLFPVVEWVDSKTNYACSEGGANNYLGDADHGKTK